MPHFILSQSNGPVRLYRSKTHGIRGTKCALLVRDIHTGAKCTKNILYVKINQAQVQLGSACGQEACSPVAHPVSNPGESPLVSMSWPN